MESPVFPSVKSRICLSSSMELDAWVTQNTGRLEASPQLSGLLGFPGLWNEPFRDPLGSFTQVWLLEDMALPSQ